MRYKETIKKIRKIEKELKKASDAELKFYTVALQEQIYSLQDTLEGILPYAFALVSEASYRVLKMRPYDVQLMAGMVLFEGKIAEMKTGEGKTLVAALPSFLHALNGDGVHVVTCNDYLASRDAEEIGQIHRFLGLSVGCITHDMQSIERKKAYACDITYVTNSELGFDYLRDNMAPNRSKMVLRGLNCCIIDEVDSILIDEARTPLIISGPSDKSTKIYIAADQFVKGLTKGEVIGEDSKLAKISGEIAERTGDFIVNEEDKNVFLTDTGIKKAEKFFGIENYADPNKLELRHHISAALRANYIMKKDKDYVVDSGKVLIVDSFTGRIMAGRRFSEGLHQAIEAKEGVEVQKETKTHATITYQTFFNKFKTKSGMTGTGITEKTEFKEIYDLDIVAIPTNKPVIRNDRKDIVYLTKKAKYKAIINEVKEAHAKGQPVLVGTASIDVSEILSNMLRDEKITHQVLNAKRHAYEASIVKHAGEFRMVTIATNMAGRGTDIKLDERSKAAGGLKVIGSERHDSRRVDNQLRGRAGRQGDPGESVFFISLEDDVMRIYGAENVANKFKNMGYDENEPIKSHLISSFVKKAQRNVEGSNYMQRKSVLNFDKVLNQQRELIYDERKRIMDLDNLDEMVNRVFKHTSKYAAESFKADHDYNRLYDEYTRIVPTKYSLDEFKRIKASNMVNIFYKDMQNIYKGITDNYLIKDDKLRTERLTFLKWIDARWMAHLEDIEQLRQGVAAQTYAQSDPKIEYSLNAYDMFDAMLSAIDILATRTLLNLKIEKNQVFRTSQIIRPKKVANA